MNDYFEHLMGHPLTITELHSSLTEKEIKELVNLFEKSALPPNAMSAEMADGFLTGLAVGPETLMAYEWLAIIFSQQTLPVCADSIAQERLLTLLQRRHRDIIDAVSRPGECTTEDNRLTPLISPVSAQAKLQGNWPGKQWAQGFYQATNSNGIWPLLSDSPQHSAMLAPVIAYQSNAKKPGDDDAQLQNNLVETLRDIHDFGRLNAYQESPEQTQALPSKDILKFGANEPCLCGSGKKYKKCCGVPETVAS